MSLKKGEEGGRRYTILSVEEVFGSPKGNKQNQLSITDDQLLRERMRERERERE